MRINGLRRVVLVVPGLLIKTRRSQRLPAVEHAARHRRVEGQRAVSRIVRAAAERIFPTPRVNLCVVLTLTP